MTNKRIVEKVTMAAQNMTEVELTENSQLIKHYIK